MGTTRGSAETIKELQAHMLEVRVLRDRAHSTVAQSRQSAPNFRLLEQAHDQFEQGVTRWVNAFDPSGLPEYKKLEAVEKQLRNHNEAMAQSTRRVEAMRRARERNPSRDPLADLVAEGKELQSVDLSEGVRLMRDLAKAKNDLAKVMAERALTLGGEATKHFEEGASAVKALPPEGW